MQAAELMWKHGMKPKDVAVRLSLSRRNVYEAARKFRKSFDRTAGVDANYAK